MVLWRDIRVIKVTLKSSKSGWRKDFSFPSNEKRKKDEMRYTEINQNWDIKVCVDKTEKGKYQVLIKHINIFLDLVKIKLLKIL